MKKVRVTIRVPSPDDLRRMQVESGFKASIVLFSSTYDLTDDEPETEATFRAVEYVEAEQLAAPYGPYACGSVETKVVSGAGA